MSPLEFTFVLICAAAGATCGYGLWVMLARLRPAPVVVAAPPAESPRPRDRAEPPLARGETKPGPAGDPALPILPVQEMLARIIEMLKAADEARAASENRLLAEMRAVLTADDPDIRDRLDRIAEALNIPGPPRRRTRRRRPVPSSTNGAPNFPRTRMTCPPATMTGPRPTTPSGTT